jgi:hypothetical protein
MQTVTIDLNRFSLTQIIDIFSMELEAEVARLDAEDGITLNAAVVNKVLTTLDVLSDMTMAHHA